MNSTNTLLPRKAVMLLFAVFCLQSINFAQNTPVQQNGRLSVCGTKLCNQYGNPIQLRGMSTHGIQWYGWDNCLTEASLDVLAYDWEADILRISLYVQSGGYETDPVGFTNQVSRLINEATERGMYALVDWHQLDPGDPNYNLENARRFFTDIASQHKNKNNIIYDICNEPNGPGVTWNRIKTYADQIIPVIRTIDDDAVILVGTQGWATFGVSGQGSLQDVVDNPLRFDNVMYTFHFYATSHRDIYLNTLDRASDVLPVFVTEFGSQEYTGDGPNDFAMTQRFIDLMHEKKISWTNWNYSDDERSGAVWQEWTCPNGPWTTSRLKPAGAWIRDKIKFPADDFPGAAPVVQSPFGGRPWMIPGKIEAENYDVGGQGVSFNDLSNGNEGNAYRTDAVDIEICTDLGGGHNVGWMQRGEWLEYTIDVTTPGQYILESRVATIEPGKYFHIQVDGKDISGPINVPNTGGWQAYQTVTTPVNLAVGKQILRVNSDTDDFNLNFLNFRHNLGSQAPSCQLTSPQNGQVFLEGGDISIAATATDPDGSIVKVAFYLNGNKIGEDTTVPYSFTWNNASPGEHQWYARAYDNDGLTANSTTIIISVASGNGGVCDAPQYVDGSTYNNGDKVQHNGKTYACAVGGWCTIGGPYEPGVGWAWEHAWNALGTCSTQALARLSVGECNASQYTQGQTYNTGDEVQNNDNRYRCKVGGWCTIGGPYEPGVGWAWEHAWEDLGACIGGNIPPEVTNLTASIIYSESLPVAVQLRARAKDPDGTILNVVLQVVGAGGAVPLLPTGTDDIYEATWSFPSYSTYTIEGNATDNEQGSTSFQFQITIKETIPGGDLLISKQQYNDFFPYRFGTDLDTYELDPAKDFFTYEALQEALARMKNIEVTFERRTGTNLYRLTRRDKTTNASKVIRVDQYFNADWNQSKPIVTQVVDYGTFANEGDEVTKKRELAAFLANIAQETTGGWDTAPGGRYAWGLHFREEVGYGTPGAPLAYRDENNMNYPPAPGKSYHGRGPIQLSWNYNYGQVSEFLYGDKNVLLNQPELVTPGCGPGISDRHLVLDDPAIP